MYTEIIESDNLFSSIRLNTPIDTLIDYRLFKHIDIIVQATDKELKDFMETGMMASDYGGTPYTNIINGLGLFTCYFESTNDNFKTAYPFRSSSFYDFFKRLWRSVYSLLH